MITMSLVWPFAIAVLLAVLTMPIAIAMRPRAISALGIQDVHVAPTSRLGGAIVFLAYVGGVGAAISVGLVTSRPSIALIMCAIPVVGAGLWEDITRRLAPRYRLIAAICAALLASLIANGVTARLDIPYVDGWLIAFPILAIALTCFMAAGACNAINIIDGAHGLASGTALMMFAGIAAIAFHVDDQLVLMQAVAMIGALAGFIAWNYPKGRIFLGDGGAYLIGFIYAELSIQIVARNAHVSAWLVIMLAAYPIVETIFSMYRRMVLLRKPSMEPDLLHLHSLVYSVVALPSARARSTEIEAANARVAPVLWLHGLCCLVAAIVFHDNTTALLIAIASYCVIYAVHYRSLWKGRLDNDSDAGLATT